MIYISLNDMLYFVVECASNSDCSGSTPVCANAGTSSSDCGKCREENILWD